MGLRKQHRSTQNAATREVFLRIRSNGLELVFSEWTVIGFIGVRGVD